MKSKSKKPRSTTANQKGYGRVLNSDKLLEQEIEFIFEERDPAGREYDFFLGKVTRSPIVKSRASGRYFILPWPDLIRLGIKAGLNKLTKPG